MPLRVAFFGTPAFAVPTLEQLVHSSHPVVGVITQPDRPRGRGQQVSDGPVKSLATALGLPVLQPARLAHDQFADQFAALNADIGVVAAYGKILPDWLLASPPLGLINVHASLLPRYRGASPIHRAVIAGDSETGVTIMRVEKMLDSGPMMAKVKRRIGPDETSDVIERDLAEMGAELLVQVVDQIAAGTQQEELQDFMVCSYAPRLTKEEGLIDWSLPASYIHNRVRGLYPWPHAYTYLDGTRLIVLNTRVDESPTAAPPGTIVTASRDDLHVATGHEGRIAIDRIQLEGGRPLGVREFLAGHRVTTGTRLGK
jgi:methionyl-tRNA formyltransferase